MKPDCCLDTSCWLEWLQGGANTAHYLPLLRTPESILVPAICLYEVWKYTERTAGTAKAQQITDWMRQGIVCPVDADLAIAAAGISHRHKIPMADSLIYATARAHGVDLWSQDDHHQPLEGTRYHPKLPAQP